MSDARLVNYSLRTGREMIDDSAVVHGKTCPKRSHEGLTGTLHGEDDDTPYDVDGCSYCGRCHVALP